MKTWCWILFLSVSHWMVDGTKIQSLKGKRLDGMVQFQSESYITYVLQQPRPYHLILLYTATDAKFNCDVCQEIQPEFTVLGESYLSAVEARRTATDDTLPIFFGVVEFPQNQNVFGMHEFTSAPHIVYVPPNESEEQEEIPEKLKWPDQNMYNVYMQGKTAESMATFVEQKTGAKFPIERSMIGLIVLLGVCVLLIGLAGYLFLTNAEFFMSKLRTRQLWMLVTLLFYTFSVSGMVFCIIRNPPTFGAAGRGQIQFIHQGGRQQYVFEGLFIGGLNICCAVCVLLLSQWALYIKNGNTRSMVMVLMMIGFYLSYKQISGIYAFKNPWYSRMSWI